MSSWFASTISRLDKTDNLADYIYFELCVRQKMCATTPASKTYGGFVTSTS